MTRERTSRDPHGKVVLSWTNKDERLITLDPMPEGARYPYRWVRPTDYRAAETRILEAVEPVGEPDAPNLLIRGDALHGLAALEVPGAAPLNLLGSVRLAYLDPPFGTQQTFQDYEDALERSIWLTMMRDRLRQVQRLLRPDGTVWVHCDDAMAGHLRVLMDEVFRPSNFIATFVWQSADSPSENTQPLATNHDYIYCYSKEEGRARLRPKPDETILRAYGKLDEATRRRYRDRLLKKNGKSSLRRDRWTMWYPIEGPDGEPVFPIHDDGRESRWGTSEKKVKGWLDANATDPDVTHHKLIWVERPGHFVRTREEPASKEEDDGLPRWRLEPDGTHWVPYTREWAPPNPVRPWPTIWATGAGAAAQTIALEAIADAEFADLDPDGPIAQALNQIATLDVLADVKTTRQAKAHQRQLFPGQPIFETPKPEELMERILTIASDRDDWVLDCFAGSGTTAAVAHKLGRRWVTVEFLRANVERYCLPRLTKVVEGTDPGGITKSAGWKGGGGFRLMEVAPSMFEEAEGVIALADWAVGGALGEATALQLGFVPEPAGPFAGRKGRMRLAVVDGIVNQAVAELILAELGEGETVLICGTGLEPEVTWQVATARPGSSAQLIPAAILNSYARPRRWTPARPKPVPAETGELAPAATAPVDRDDGHGRSAVAAVATAAETKA